MSIYFQVLLMVFLCISCSGQVSTVEERSVGGPCQDCEALRDYLQGDIVLGATDTITGFDRYSPKIKLSGTVFQRDGKTHAPNVILYLYHTDRKGIYQPSTAPAGWEKIHGQYRTWLRTGEDGRYSFYTFRPAPYPEVNEPEHIHVYVKEPSTIPYYLDSYFFESDPKLTLQKRQSLKNRGGSGVVKLVKEGEVWKGNRDLILGFNIPNY